LRRQAGSKLLGGHVTSAHSRHYAWQALAGRAARAKSSGRNGIASNGTQAGDEQNEADLVRAFGLPRRDRGGAVILIDPFLDNPLFQGDQEEAYGGTTHVILTHGPEVGEPFTL
jgi:hypothetical protein